MSTRKLCFWCKKNKILKKKKKRQQKKLSNMSFIYACDYSYISQRKSGDLMITFIHLAIMPPTPLHRFQPNLLYGFLCDRLMPHTKFVICTKLESYCFSGFGGVVIKEKSFFQLTLLPWKPNKIATGHETHKLGRQSLNNHNCQIWFTSLHCL